MPVTRPPYSGSSREMVIAYDLGTTYSGASYCVLDPAVVPQIQGVTRFPADEHLAGNSKIPSVMYYDKQGNLKAAGAEALLDANMERAAKEGWLLLRWWKLLLAPMEIAGGSTLCTPELPLNKTIIDVFADFLGYLHGCTKRYISESQASGDLLWDSVQTRIKFVLTHPNGWEGRQQTMMRRAAILAGLIPNSDDGRSRISFVTEGEASFNYCATNSLSADAFKENQNIIIIDAGGGTIDISAYSITAAAPLSVDELFSPECVLQGSEFVTARAEEHIRKKLRNSTFDTPDDIANILAFFDAKVKRIFADEEDSVRIKFASTRDSDAARGILRGQLKLSGSEVSTFFEPSVDSIVDVVGVHFKRLPSENTNVFLVGGFAASPWLFACLQEEFSRLGLNISRPDGHTNKAVADGAISFYLDHFVATRVAKYTYGTSCASAYNHFNLEHRKRSHKVTRSISGDKCLPCAFSSILKKGARVSATQEFSTAMKFEMSQYSSQLSSEISCYKGILENPKWTDTEPGMFSELCHITADISAVPKVMKCNSKGQSYFEQNAQIVLLFGLTELKAQLRWEHNGKEMRSGAKIVYDEED